MIQSLSLIFPIAVIFCLINHRLFKLPSSIALVISGAAVAISILLLQNFFPSLREFAVGTLDTVDFGSILLDGFLGFLLFAGAIHIDLRQLDVSKWSILAFSTVSVLITATLVGAVTFYLAPLVGVEIPFVYCLLFGALISPTDPVAVLAILGDSKISDSLLVKFKGESLFNDGIGVVLFAGVLLVIKMTNDGSFDGIYSEVGWLLLKEIGGGLMLGALIGFIAFQAIKYASGAHQLVTMISLAAVVGGYSVAQFLHVSGPLAMVVAGLIIGNQLHLEDEINESHEVLTSFWEMISETLDAIVFFMIGLSITSVQFSWNTSILGVLVIILVLAARFVSIYTPYSLLKHDSQHRLSIATILTWGGLRGAVSIALVLGTTDMDYSNTLLVLTFFVVIFGIVVQGLTIGKVYRSLFKNDTMP
ncbi:cation:proton antiporter [Nonlabens ponticola]|uniref:Sodium:proton antiporter n=1 Tax=Nonlabens ponticola TaxID=2496866 RepID=A0A3S9N097_9FLAO|nr:sodium:proton antiporter [Nonlabens ponticola]AZQ44808.1 sodium:proton antiporter [Nonlabens ponticola]